MERKEFNSLNEAALQVQFNEELKNPPHLQREPLSKVKKKLAQFRHGEAKQKSKNAWDAGGERAVYGGTPNDDKLLQKSAEQEDRSERERERFKGDAPDKWDPTPEEAAKLKRQQKRIKLGKTAGEFEGDKDIRKALRARAVKEYFEAYFGGTLNESTSDEDIMEAVYDLIDLCEAVCDLVEGQPSIENRLDEKLRHPPRPTWDEIASKAAKRSAKEKPLSDEEKQKRWDKAGLNMHQIRGTDPNYVHRNNPKFNPRTGKLD
jgi:hypothetical protein